MKTNPSKQQTFVITNFITLAVNWNGVTETQLKVKQEITELEGHS